MDERSEGTPTRPQEPRTDARSGRDDETEGAAPSSPEKRLADLEQSVRKIRASLIPTEPQEWEKRRQERLEWEADYDALWDEMCDYRLALQLIASSPPGCTATADLSIQAAREVLKRYENDTE